VTRRHFVALASLFMKPDPPAFALGVVILYPHGHDRANPGKSISHDGDQRPIT